MLDQAHDLRRLAGHDGRADRPPARPALLAVTGGKGGVGTTTVALGLAGSLKHAGRHVLFVDADPRGGSAAMLCGIEERRSLADVLAGRQSWIEAAEMGPGGIRLIAGARWSEDLGPGSPAAAERLIKLLNTTSGEAEVAVVDVGNSPGRAVRRICRVADAIVVVTTSEPAAVVGAFAAIRAMVHASRNQDETDAVAPGLPVYVWVNKAKRARDAKLVRDHLVRACHRLLGIEIATGDGDCLWCAAIAANERIS